MSLQTVLPLLASAWVLTFGAETEEHRNYTFGKVMDATAVLSANGEVIEFTTTSTGLPLSNHYGTCPPNGKDGA